MLVAGEVADQTARRKFGELLLAELLGVVGRDDGDQILRGALDAEAGEEILDHLHAADLVEHREGDLPPARQDVGREFVVGRKHRHDVFRQREGAADVGAELIPVGVARIDVVEKEDETVVRPGGERFDQVAPAPLQRLRFGQDQHEAGLRQHVGDGQAGLAVPRQTVDQKRQIGLACGEFPEVVAEGAPHARIAEETVERLGGIHLRREKFPADEAEDPVAAEAVTLRQQCGKLPGRIGHRRREEFQGGGQSTGPVRRVERRRGESDRTEQMHRLFQQERRRRPRRFRRQLSGQHPVFDERLEEQSPQPGIERRRAAFAEQCVEVVRRGRFAGNPLLSRREPAQQAAEPAEDDLLRGDHLPRGVGAGEEEVECIDAGSQTIGRSGISHRITPPAVCGRSSPPP